MRSRRLLCSVLACIAALTSCASAETQAGATPAEVDFDALDSDLEAWADEVPGGAVGFVRLADGRTHLIDVGEDATTGDPLAAEDRVRVGSISKVYTATLVLQLVDQGLVELDEPVSTYVTGTSVRDDITVRHILSHESGLPNYTEELALIEPSIAVPTLQFDPQTIVSFVADGQDFAPGAQFSYSNTNFIVAGQIVESVTGQSLDAALNEQIAAPLGLTETNFDDGRIDDVTSGYSAALVEGSSGGRNYQSIAQLAWAAGSLVTTVEELAIFLDALLIEDQLLSAESLNAMLGLIPDGADYGLGLAPGTDFGVGHDGSIFGFNSTAQVDAATGEMVILVVNNDARRPAIVTALITERTGIG